MTTRQRLEHRLDGILSLYVKIRDSFGSSFRCISCGSLFPLKMGEAGHYVPRVHKSVRFDERNVNLQCLKCNRELLGAIENYRVNLVKKIGEKEVIKLENLKNSIVKHSESDLRDMIKYYKQKIKEYE